MNHKYQWILTTTIFTTLLMTQGTFAQPFYKWVDEKGATHYSQTPPPKPAQKINIDDHTPSPSSSEHASGNNIQTSDHSKAAKPAQSEDRCTKLKATVAQYSNGTLHPQMESNGEVSLMIDGQKVVGARGLAALEVQECGYNAR